MKETFYVTTPIFYVNAKPHLGHVYVGLLADTLTRFKRQRGVDTFFLTGTDEHGVNIERAAEERGLPFQQHVDAVVAEFKQAFAQAGIQPDRWIRTTDPNHEAGVQKMWLVLKERGYIYKGEYEGWFCAYCNEFKDVEPGDEHPQCPEHDRPLDRVSEESYFFRLSALQERLLDLYRTMPDFVQPESRLNEVVSFVAGGLKDLSVSRVSVKWGIPVPDDPGHTIYVWWDALANYITALGWGNDGYSGFETYWPATHLIGKDILRFHAVYWPAFLMAAGVELPRAVMTHGMWLSGGRKMSKTLGNVISLPILFKHFSPDAIRYFVLREMAFGHDGDFTYGALIDRVNAELADGIGNLASRTLTMVRNYFGGVPPALEAAGDTVLGRDIEEVRASIEEAKRKIDESMGELAFSRALEALASSVSRVDKLISDHQPWKLAKDESRKPDLAAVIAAAYEALRHIVPTIAPALPAAAPGIWAQMGLHGDPASLNPNSILWGELSAPPKIGAIEPAFPKLHKGKVMTEIEADVEQERLAQLNAGNVKGGGAGAVPGESGDGARATGAAPGEPAPLAETIGIEDFVKVDLRAATVLAAERIPKADKLLKLRVDLGEAEPRQILAGIAEYYTPEQMVGRKIVVVANLAPRKLRGLESNGMLLAASIGEKGQPVLATFAEDVPNGARLK